MSRRPQQETASQSGATTVPSQGAALDGTPRLLAMAVEMAADALFVHDDTGAFLDVNQRACELLGYTREDLLGMTVFDVTQNLERVPAQATWARIQNGQSLTLVEYYRRGDGSACPVEVRTCGYQAEGRRLFCSVVRPLSERERQQEALQESHQRLSLALRAAHMGVWIAEVRTGALRWDSVVDGLFGLAPGAFRGSYEAYLALIHPEDRERVRQSSVHSGNHRIYDVEFRVIHPDGSLHWLHSVGEPLRDERGRLRQVHGVTWDITASKQAEAALRASEERWRVAHELSLDAFTILQSVRNEQGVIVDFEWVYANPMAATLLRRPQETLLGNRLLNVLPGNLTSSALFQEYVEIVATGVPVDREHFYNADGITGWFRNMTVKLGDGVANSFRDISERKRAYEELELRVQERTAELQQAQRALHSEKEALQRERDFAESIIETAQTLILVLDLDGRIVRFNPYLEELSGYRLTDVQGRDWFSTFLPERARARAKALFLRASEGLHSYRNLDLIVTKAGREREIEWSNTTLRDAERQVIGLLAIGQDLTERRRLEIWFQSLIHTTQDAVVSIDRRGRIVLFNPAAERIFGYTYAEVRGQSVTLLMPEPYASEHDHYVERYERTREPRAIGRIRSVTAKRRSGELFPIELSVTELPVDEEAHYAAFIRDISEKDRLQQQLLERERLAAIGTTAAKFAHEIGNPLNGLSMSVQLLARRLTSPGNRVEEKVIEQVHGLRGEIHRLSSLLHEFRSLARRQDLTCRMLHLRTIVQEVLTAEQAYYESRGVVVVLLIPESLSPLLADGDKLKQVFFNLCKNAVEAMPMGGRLTIQCRDAGAQVIIDIRDTGVGIPAGVNILEPFITTKPEGTGLGLPIVRQIIAAHGGALTYQSEPGQGTTFTISLPKAAVEH